MSSASHTTTADLGHGLFWRLGHPSSWSLRARLLAAQTVVMAVARSATGAGALLALDRFLMQQLDDRVVETGWRSSILYALAHPR